jgi:hypothetical protein
MNPDRQRDTVKFLLHDRNRKCTAAWNAVLPGAPITIGARSGSSVVIGRSISSTNTYTQHDADQILGTHTSDLAPIHFGAIPARLDAEGHDIARVRLPSDASAIILSLNQKSSSGMRSREGRRRVPTSA